MQYWSEFTKITLNSNFYWNYKFDTFELQAFIQFLEDSSQIIKELHVLLTMNIKLVLIFGKQHFKVLYLK